HINLDLTLLSGQTFLWSKIEDFYYGTFTDKIVKIKKEGEDLIWQTYPTKDDFDFINKYFKLNQNHLSKVQAIGSDKHVQTALQKYPGLIVLNQPFHETIFSFLLAQNKNIKAIRKSLSILKEQNKNIVKV